VGKAAPQGISQQPTGVMIIDFNDVTPGRYFSIPDGYDGFHWHGMGVSSGTQTPTSGYAHVSNAGSMVGFTYSGDNVGAPGWFSSDRDFDLKSGTFAAAWNNGLHVKIVGFDDGVKVAVLKTVLDTTATEITFDSSFDSIDKVRFSTHGGVDANPEDGQGAHLALEDLVVHKEPPSEFVV
jgi:hypothetical protein